MIRDAYQKIKSGGRDCRHPGWRGSGPALFELFLKRIYLAWKKPATKFKTKFQQSFFEIAQKPGNKLRESRRERVPENAHEKEVNPGGSARNPSLRGC